MTHHLRSLLSKVIGTAVDWTTTLQIYTHASGSAQRQAVDQLESLLFPNLPKLANGQISK